MKAYLDDKNLNKQKRLKKSKARALRKLIYVALLLCFGIAAMMWVIPFSTRQESNAHISNTTQLSMGDQSNGDETAWSLILVNKWNSIPEDYKVELTKLTTGESVDKRIYPYLQEMFNAARESGINPVVVSGYRTTEKQQSLLDEKIADYKREGYQTKESIDKAENWVAVPGTSEHQLGIAVDINAEGFNARNEEVYEWLYQNSYKFGFIYRYPADKTEITGIRDEPWHYRYVGVRVATEIYNKGICLEEYLGKTNERGN